MKPTAKQLFAAACLILPVSSVKAVNLLVPTDFITGGVVTGSDFVVGVAGTAAGANNWPAAEPPSDMINGFIGGPGEKYLNFAEVNTGVIITPAASLSLLNTMTLWVANDAIERDPADFRIYGTNSPISGSGPFSLSLFDLITEDALALPDTRDTVTDTTGFNQTVTIGATAAYTSYLLMFPTVKNSSANSMQISEVQFDATLVPEPATASFAGLLLLGLARRRR